jgi:NADPH:quinone reductase-like Zn-dependent oxidoreductase
MADVARANQGAVPVAAEGAGWRERIVPGRFDGRTVIVTGAASGIGRATASRVAREGGTVVAVDISGDRLDELVASLPDSQLVAVTGDITKAEDIDRIVAAAGSTIDGGFSLGRVRRRSRPTAVSAPGGGRRRQAPWSAR